MSVAINVTPRLIDAMAAEGLSMPEECRTVILKMPADGIVSLNFETSIYGERLAAFGRALIRLGTGFVPEVAANRVGDVVDMLKEHPTAPQPTRVRFPDGQEFDVVDDPGAPLVQLCKCDCPETLQDYGPFGALHESPQQADGHRDLNLDEGSVIGAAASGTSGDW